MLRFTLWLGGMGVFAMVMVWFLLGGFSRASLRQDPRPGPLAREAQAFVAQGPPLPRLQPNPAADMRTLRAHENAILRSYDWNDAARTTARVPADRALELMIARGSAAPLAGANP